MTRKRRESRTGMFVGSAALVGVYLAIHNGPVKPGPAVAVAAAAVPPPPAAAPAHPAPPPHPGSRTDWAAEVLHGAGLPVNDVTVQAMLTWMLAEGGGFGNQASFDPLNLNPPADTPWPGKHASGAWAFPDWADGVRFTIAVLHQANYAGIYAAFRASRSYHSIIVAIVTGGWSGDNYAGNHVMQAALRR